MIPLTHPNDLLATVRAEKARRNLHTFVKAYWPIVEPAMPFIDNWHVGAICEHLEAVSRGEILRLLINVPPGHAKSLLVSVFWPAWVWIDNPSWRGLFSSHALDLAVRDSIRCRTLIESSTYRAAYSNCPRCGAWPDSDHPTDHDATCKGWALTEDQNVKSYFRNTRTGERKCLSVGSGVIGFRGNAVICDDPLNLLDSFSKAKRDEAHLFWFGAMSSRLNDQRRGSRVLIMQRLHEDDPSGRILDMGGYEHLCLPSEFDRTNRAITFITKHDALTCELSRELGKPGVAEYEPEPEIEDDDQEHNHPIDDTTACDCPRRKFWEDPRQRDGELLFRRLFPAPVLAQAKKDLGSSGYAGQHQQRPAPEEGGMFKKFWWRWYKPSHRAVADGGEYKAPRPKGCWEGPAVVQPSSFDRVVLSVDCTFKDTDGTDFVSFQVWGCVRADRYLLDRVKARLDFPGTIKQFIKICKKWPEAQRKYVEDKANGPAIISTLKRRIAGILPVEPYGNKVARAASVAPEIESGNVFLPDGAPWIEEYVTEHAQFPNAKHDDDVDATSQALNELAGRAGASRARGMANM